MHLDLIRSIQNPFSTMVPVRERSSLIWFNVKGRTRFLIKRIFVGLDVGGLGDFTCGISFTMDIFRLVAVSGRTIGKNGRFMSRTIALIKRTVVLYNESCMCVRACACERYLPIWLSILALPFLAAPFFCRFSSVILSFVLSPELCRLSLLLWRSLSSSSSFERRTSLMDNGFAPGTRAYRIIIKIVGLLLNYRIKLENFCTQKWKMNARYGKLSYLERIGRNGERGGSIRRKRDPPSTFPGHAFRFLFVAVMIFLKRDMRT